MNFITIYKMVAILLCDLYFNPLHFYFTLTVFMLMPMLEVQKGCNGDVDTCI